MLKIQVANNTVKADIVIGRKKRNKENKSIRSSNTGSTLKVTGYQGRESLGTQGVYLRRGEGQGLGERLLCTAGISRTVALRWVRLVCR